MERASLRLNEMKKTLQLDLDEKYNKVSRKDGEFLQRVSSRFARDL